MVQEAKRLEEKYLKESSPLELNLPGNINQNLKDKLSSGSITTNSFDEAQNSIFLTMEAVNHSHRLKD